MTAAVGEVEATDQYGTTGCCCFLFFIYLVFGTGLHRISRYPCQTIPAHDVSLSCAVLRTAGTTCAIMHSGDWRTVSWCTKCDFSQQTCERASFAPNSERQAQCAHAPSDKNDTETRSDTVCKKIFYKCDFNFNTSIFRTQIKSQRRRCCLFWLEKLFPDFLSMFIFGKINEPLNDDNDWGR